MAAVATGARGATRMPRWNTTLAREHFAGSRCRNLEKMTQVLRDRAPELRDRYGTPYKRRFHDKFMGVGEPACYARDLARQHADPRMNAEDRPSGQ
jgi:hypothetical protein